MRHTRDQRGKAECKQLHVWVRSVGMVTTGVTSGEVWDLGLGVGWTKDVCGVCVGAPFHYLFDIQPAPVLDKGSRQPAKS